MKTAFWPTEHEGGEPRERGAWARFFSEALRAPLRVGAVAPSSRAVGRLLAEVADLAAAQTVVELGAGVGSLTQEIVLAMPRRARLLAIERNAAFAGMLAERYGGDCVACACATELTAVAAARGVAEADAVISSLPWTVFDAETQRVVLTGARAMLRPGGRFATVVCAGLHGTARGREFAARLATEFPGVRRSRIVWRNVPPVFVYFAERR